MRRFILGDHHVSATVLHLRQDLSALGGWCDLVILGKLNKQLGSRCRFHLEMAGTSGIHRHNCLEDIGILCEARAHLVVDGEQPSAAAERFCCPPADKPGTDLKPRRQKPSKMATTNPSRTRLRAYSK